MPRRLPPEGSWFRTMAELALYLGNIPIKGDSYDLNDEGVDTLLTIFFNSFGIEENSINVKEALERLNGDLAGRKNLFRFILGGRNSAFLRKIKETLLVAGEISPQVSVPDDYHIILVKMFQKLKEDSDFLIDVKASVPAFLKLGYLEYISEYGASGRRKSQEFLSSDVVTITIALIGHIFSFTGGRYHHFVLQRRDIFQLIAPYWARKWMISVKSRIAPLFRSRDFPPTETLISLVTSMISYESYREVSRLITTFGIPVYHANIQCSRNRCNMVNMKNLILREPISIMFDRNINPFAVGRARSALLKLYAAATVGEGLKVGNPNMRQKVKQNIYDGILDYSQKFILYSMTGNSQTAYLAMRRLNEMKAFLSDINARINEDNAAGLVDELLNFTVMMI